MGNKYLTQALEDGEFEMAKDMIEMATDYNEAEQVVFSVLSHERTPQELIELVLETFLNSRKNRYGQHGYWVHSLSHFTDILWQRKMFDWIKKFNQVAFKGACELNDSNCSERLVNDFAEYAAFDDDPADFHITDENLTWMDWKYLTAAKVRIEAGKLESEADWLKTKLKHPVDCYIQTGFNDKDFEKDVERLDQIAENDPEKEELIEKALRAIELKIQEMLKTANGWLVETFKKSLVVLKDMLQDY